jgi:DmsE family decaheme c-type cytochrome
VRKLTHFKRPLRATFLATTCMSLLLLGFASCKSPHEVTRRAATDLAPGSPQGNKLFHQVSYEAVGAKLPTIEGAEYVNDDELCAGCHGAYAKSFDQKNVHRGDSCESCHGPGSKHLETQGKEPGLIFSFKTGDPVVRAEACLKCHEESNCTEGARWRTSKHAQCRVTCVDCHRGHYDIPPGTKATTDPGASITRPDAAGRLTAYQKSASGSSKNGGQGYVKPKKNVPSLKGTSDHMGAVSPGICYKCHGDMQVYQQIAGPHQICGPNGFDCTTCHDPHGQIIESTRRDLCMQCHEKHAPTMAFDSSAHDQNGVRCTDCHNPHPRTRVPRIVDVSHGNGPPVLRANRKQMAVDDPYTCYKCHPKIYGLNALPSHHPIKEGKMFCSDCHDAHGQQTANLREATVNLLCYKCHAEKQGPYAFEHPPVRENCDYCHNPHGTVANNLLKQPATFLCLRCHPGHYGQHNIPAANPITLRIDQDPTLRKPFYTDCTQCHQQIHGTDRVSQRGDAFFTR